MARKRVVVVGVGFGGLNVAKTLARKDVDVLLVDRNNYHCFHPLLYQVATAGVEEENVVYPVRAIIRNWANTDFLLAEARGVDVENKQLVTNQGDVPYDYLVLAAGSVSTYYGIEGAETYAYDLKELEDAVLVRNDVLTLFERAAEEEDPERRRALLTFVVIGGGPTGVEFAGALAELIQHSLDKDYPKVPVENSRVILVEALPNLLRAMPEELQDYTQRRLERLGVEIMLNTPVTAVRRGQVELEGGQTIHTHMVFWGAGVRGSALASTLPVELTRRAQVPVESDLTVPGHPEVFVIGDMAYVEQDGHALPLMAPVAMQQGRYVGRTILARERGQQAEAFRYQGRGTMAIIGRYAAVAYAYGMKLKGFIAWVIWLVLHLYYLAGFRNRLLAMMNWGYAYILLDPKLRLITEPCEARAAVEKQID